MIPAMKNMHALLMLTTVMIALNGCGIQRPERGVDGEVVLDGLKSPEVKA